VFDEPTPQALLAAVRRALEALRAPETWLRIQRAAMARDSGWASAARAYLALYASMPGVDSGQ